MDKFDAWRYVQCNMGAHTIFDDEIMTQAAIPSATVMNGLRHIVQALRQSSSHVERVTGLTGAQYYLLRQISRHDRLSVNDLAALTFTHQSTVSEVIGKLEARGLVVRRRSPDDGRRAELGLSEAGEALLAGGYLTAQERIAAALETLPEATVQGLADGLNALITSGGLDATPPVLFFENNRNSTT